MKPRIRYLKTKTVRSVSFDAHVSNVVNHSQHSQGFVVEVTGSTEDHEFLEQVRTLMVGSGNVRVKLTVIP